MGEDGGRPDGVEWLTAERPRRPRRPRLLWSVLVLVAVLAAASVVVIQDRARTPFPPDLSSPRPLPATRRPTPAPPAVTERQLAPQVFGVTADWELYGRSDEAVVRIQLAKGILTRTAVPPLDSTGPVSFLVTGDVAVIRPLDFVAGYQVRDGQAVGLLPAELDSGLALPGPKAGQVWAAGYGDDRTHVSLVRLRGAGEENVLILGPVGPDMLAADGAGSFVYRSGGETFAYRPTSDRPVTRGTLLAAGPRIWLIADCPRTRCRATVVDRKTGQTRALRTRLENQWMSGAVSPDGCHAALLPATSFARDTLRLVDLVSGKMTSLRVRPDPTAGLGAMVWSPDSRLLLVAGDDGSLWALTADGEVVEVRTLGLPPLRQLALER